MWQQRLLGTWVMEWKEPGVLGHRRIYECSFQLNSWIPNPVTVEMLIGSSSGGGCLTVIVMIKGARW